jgi:excisionase family DNA binding protein
VTVAERLRQLAQALPSDGATVTLSRADLLALVEGAEDPGTSTGRDLTVEQIASEVGRKPVTIRQWLVAGSLRGYKLNRRDWRVPRTALREFLDRQAAGPEQAPPERPVDVQAWRKLSRRRKKEA